MPNSRKTPPTLETLARDIEAAATELHGAWMIVCTGDDLATNEKKVIELLSSARAAIEAVSLDVRRITGATRPRPRLRARPPSAREVQKLEGLAARLKDGF